MADDVQGEGVEERLKKPLAQAFDLVLREYTGYTDEFRVETRPTGYPGAPFVGLIRYSEQIFSCADKGATRCGVKQTTPITEIFRFQDGRWIY